MDGQLPPHVKELMEELGPSFSFPESRSRFHDVDSCSSGDEDDQDKAGGDSTGLLTHLPRSSIIHEMVRLDSTDKVGKCLDFGVGVNTPDNMGETPLFCTISKSMVDYLVDMGADIEWKNTLSGCSAFFKHASQGNHKPMKAIAAHLQRRKKLADALKETAIYTNRTALHAAALNGLVSTVRELLALGAEKDAKDAYGKTSKDLAAAGGFDEIVSLLT
jgi:ankyrin repeat protein